MISRAVYTVVLFFLYSCGKEDSRVPDVPVTYTFTEQDFSINSRNGILLVNNKGVAGLLIYRGPNGFVVFDRCSTVNPEKRCAVTPDESGLTATDPCSGAVFLLLDGSPAKAPAKFSLKQYSITRTNGGYSVIN